MSDAFEAAFARTMRLEGGFKLHKVEGDRGGWTYAGIARNFNPSWPGWAYADRGDVPPTELVRKFYREAYWEPLKCEALPPEVALDLFDYAVNTSAPYRPTHAAKMAQIVAGVIPDGAIGPKSVAALSAMPAGSFREKFFAAKIKRYATIVNRDRSQSKFLLGWVNRSLEALS